MFYEIYKDLCMKIGKSPSAVAEELGINKSNVSNWKNNGYQPRGEALSKIADYFGVTTDYLLEKDDPNGMDSSPQRKVLFSLAQKMDEDQIQKINDTIKEMFNVYVNEAYCEDALNILWHEISHIKDNDFYSMSDIETIEEKADRAIITETDIKNLDIRAC